MTTDNDSVREEFEKWWDEADDIPNDGPWKHDTPIQFSWAAWQASRERYVQRITDLERRNGELEKDAARYQWLKGSVSERLTSKSLLNEHCVYKYHCLYSNQSRFRTITFINFGEIPTLCPNRLNNHA